MPLRVSSTPKPCVGGTKKYRCAQNASAAVTRPGRDRRRALPRARRAERRGRAWSSRRDDPIGGASSAVTSATARMPAPATTSSHRRPGTPPRPRGGHASRESANHSQSRVRHLPPGGALRCTLRRTVSRFYRRDLPTRAPEGARLRVRPRTCTVEALGTLRLAAQCLRLARRHASRQPGRPRELHDGLDARPRARLAARPSLRRPRPAGARSRGRARAAVGARAPEAVEGACSLLVAHSRPLVAHAQLGDGDRRSPPTP